VSKTNKEVAAQVTKALTDSLQSLVDGGLGEYLQGLPPEIVVDPLLRPDCTCAI
jgi:hypothetical protein